MQRASFALASAVLFAFAACGSPPPAAPPKTATTAPRCEPAADAGAPAAPHGPVDVDHVKDDVIKRINDNDGRGLFDLFATSMRASFPVGMTVQFVDGVRTAKGPISTTTRTAGETDSRSATYTAKAEHGEWKIELHVDEGGQIIGLTIHEERAPDPPVADSKIPLSLPVRGKWLVAWAGETPDVNPHVTNREQRRAADLVVAEGGKHFKNDGKKNDDYFAYGKEVLAMADGTVTTVVDGVPENVPGTLDAFFVPGNVIILEHPGALYSVYAHLQPGKTKVKVGAKVKQGTVLGLCGNSGNASEPHLHVQLMDAPMLAHAYGVNGIFANVMVTRDGQATKIDAYTFKKGDVVEPAR
jgi:murein DD-endopeptidase MepM/ murein hydrolase activator NlpD